MSSDKIKKTKSKRLSKKNTTQESVTDESVAPVVNDSEPVVDESVAQVVDDRDPVESVPFVDDLKSKKDISPEWVLEQLDETLLYLNKLLDDVKNNVIINPRQLNSNIKKLQTVKQKSFKLFSKGAKLKKVKIFKSSGFMKPVKVSKELCSFAGWEEDDTHSRIDVTNLLCSYIKNKNLQDPKFKKNIIPDAKLSAILNYDPSLSQEPLTYCLMQRLIQPHFVK